MMYLSKSLLKLYQTYKNNLEKVWVGIIIAIVDHTINILKYKPLSGSSYIKLPKELDYRKQDLSENQDIDENK